jgi:hypothetical protein
VVPDILKQNVAFIFQDSRFMGFKNFKMKGKAFFGTSTTTSQATQRHITEVQNPMKHRCENLKTHLILRTFIPSLSAARNERKKFNYA